MHALQRHVKSIDLWLLEMYVFPGKLQRSVLARQAGNVLLAAMQ